MYGNILSRAQCHQIKETETNVQNSKEPVTQTSLHLIFIASFNRHFFHIFKISLFMCVCAQSCPILCNPIDLACQASLSMKFSRQKYWSGLPFPSPGYLPDPGIEPRSPVLQADTLTYEPPGNDTGEAAEGRNTFFRNEMQMLVQTTIYCKLNY